MANERRIALRYFFRTLFERTDGGFIELRPFRSDGTPDHCERWFHPTRFSDSLANAALSIGRRLDVYFGICTRTSDGAIECRGTSQYLDQLPAFWADLDTKTFGSLRQAREALHRFAIPPSILVFTGHGFHAYWLLEEAVALETADRAMLESALRVLQTQILGGDNVADLARILRAPYTFNLKEPGRRIRAKIARFTHTRYQLEELLDAIPWRGFPLPDFATGGGLSEGRFHGIERVLESDFMAFCRGYARSLPEPLWYAMITNLIGFMDGREAIHELSLPHPRYSFAETERKIAHALRDAPGPHTYRYIENHGFESVDLLDPELPSPASRAFRRRSRLGSGASGQQQDGDQN